MPQQDCHLKHPLSYQHQGGCQPKGCPYASARHDKKNRNRCPSLGPPGSWLMDGGQISWCSWGAESLALRDGLLSPSHSAHSCFLTLYPQPNHIPCVLDRCKGFSRLFSPKSLCELLPEYLQIPLSHLPFLPNH